MRDDRPILKHGDVALCRGHVVVILEMGVWKLAVSLEDHDPQPYPNSFPMQRLGYCPATRHVNINEPKDAARLREDRFFDHIKEGLYESYEGEDTGGPPECGEDGGE